MIRILVLVCCFVPIANGQTQDREMELILRGRDDIELVRFIRERILHKTKARQLGDMKNYEDSFSVQKRKLRKGGAAPSSSFEMIALKGGEFVMGDISKERKNHPDEKPAHEVTVSPLWIGKYEVTWGLYEQFMITGDARHRNGELEYPTEKTKFFQVISSPTTPYMGMDFGMGNESDHPAICMTQHAANKFCQWLSYKTGHFYRLPTEAEWEYACRAGTKGDYSCPTDKLAEYAVLDPTQTRVGYEKVGTKKPNPWGIYDMHGNVMEWCLDQYDAVAYGIRGRNDHDPFIRPNRIYPRVARGGSWYDVAEDCRSSSRFYSEPSWNDQDPQLPKSLWYLSDAHWLGFRIVRPLKIPSAKEMHFYWNCAAPQYPDGSRRQSRPSPFER